MENLNISQKKEERYLYNIEILLSEAQLKLLCETDGDLEYEYLETYKEMTVDNYDEPVTANPSFDMGMGADINDILSLGFMVYPFLYKQLKRISLEDLNFHPFRCQAHIIEEVKSKLVDCEIKGTGYTPMTIARTSDGTIVDLNNL